MSVTPSVKLLPEAKRQCRIFLPAPWWRSASDDDIETEIIENGRSNRIIKCQLSNKITIPDRVPRRVIVRFFGSTLTGEGNRYKLMTHGAENVLLRRFYKFNMGPKLLGCFDGGRIETFIDLPLASLQQFRSLDMIKIFAQKAAMIHSLDSPTIKLRYAKPHWSTMGETLLKKIDTIKSDDFKDEKERLWWQDIRKFDFHSCHVKYTKLLNTVKNRITLCHNDFNITNFLIKTVDDRIVDCVALDLENVLYNQRGIDIGSYFLSMQNGSEISEFTIEDSTLETFIDEYLKHWKCTKKYSPDIDTRENLLEEFKFGITFDFIFCCFWFIVHEEFVKDEVLIQNAWRYIRYHQYYAQKWAF